jgi:hypothetical protein
MYLKYYYYIILNCFFIFIDDPFHSTGEILRKDGQGRISRRLRPTHKQFQTRDNNIFNIPGNPPVPILHPSVKG